MENKEPEVREFKECPGCGSTERFVANEARKEGLENADMYGLNCRPKLQPNGEMAPQISGLPVFLGPVIDDETMKKSLVGHRFPLFAAPVDSCENCGMIYAFQHQVREGQKLPDAPTPMQPPGRPQIRGQGMSTIQDLLRGPFGNP